MSEAVSSTIELESYVLGAAAIQAEHQGPQECTLTSTQPNLGAMLNTLMEKRKKLEDEINERQ